jgi:hypothetical protein
MSILSKLGIVKSKSQSPTVSIEQCCNAKRDNILNNYGK